MKSKIVSILSSISALIIGSCGGACGLACLTGGCCGGVALFGLIGLSGSTLQFFEKLTPVFLVLTILSLSYAFYKAYKPKPVDYCNTANDNNGDSCCVKEKKASFFQSKSFLWATTILCAIMWIYPYASKLNNSNTSSCSFASNVTDTIVKNTSVIKNSCEQNKDTIIIGSKINPCCPKTNTCSKKCSKK